MENIRIIIAGGGTGGHIFPGIAIGRALQESAPDAELLFVGARDRMEMEKIPEAGFRIEGLWISGLQRSLSLKNLLFPVKLLHSLWVARKILKRFRPHVVVGVGGFASGPLCRMAAVLGIPIVIQEQNSYPGITNKWLSRFATAICVAFPDMDAFFSKEKLHLTGNPVRKEFQQEMTKEMARKKWDLQPGRCTVLIFGGSLGSGALNKVMESKSTQIAEGDEQWLWQVGKIYELEYLSCETAKLKNVIPMTFINDMPSAYAAADLVVCRAGALTIAELAVAGKAALLVPSPNVAEDHQTRNAQTLQKENAAEMITDKELDKLLLQKIRELLQDEKKRKTMERNIKAFAKPDADAKIASIVLEIAKKKCA